MGRIIRRGLAALLIVTGLLTAAIVGAAVQIFDGAGQYIMSDFEKHDIAKQRAQRRAERDAQKKAGVALKTFSRSINSELTDDEVSAVTNNIIKVSDVKIVPVTFETEGEAGLMYKATLKATIDTDGIYSWLKRDDKEKVNIIQRNNELQDSIQKNDKQVEDLKEKYKLATSQAEKDHILKQMEQVDRDFLEYQKGEEGNRNYYAEDYHGAIKIYSEAIKLNPNLEEAYNNRGAAYNELKEYERAIQDFNKAIEINPNFAYSAYYNRGLAYANLKQYDRAIKDYSKAIQINPELSQAYCNRGNAYFNQKKYELAIQDYDKAIELNPNFATVYNLRGISYIMIGNINQAIENINKSIELEPNNPNSYHIRGLLYKAIGDMEKAQADFAKAKELGHE